MNKKLTAEQRKELFYILFKLKGLYEDDDKKIACPLYTAYKIMSPLYSGPTRTDGQLIYLAAQGYNEPEIINIFGTPEEFDSKGKEQIRKEIRLFLYHGGFANVDEMAVAYNRDILPIIKAGVAKMGW